MTENNRLIAEFMGVKQHRFDGLTKIEKILKYDFDWNWLMEVVQRITDLNNVVEIHDNHVRVVSNERNNALIDVVEGSMLEATYNACVEFIKWYNQNK
jgi:hypothetical protein